MPASNSPNRNIQPSDSRQEASPFTTLIAGLAGALVLLLELKIQQGFARTLDASWGEVLSWGIAHGAQWGKDLVFTYGPLGFATPDLPFDPATYLPTLLAQLGLAATTAWLVVINLRRLPLASGLAFVLATIVLGWSWSTSSAQMIAYPLAAIALERTANQVAPARMNQHLLVLWLAAFAALLPMIKFSMFPLWLVWLPVGALILWRSGSRALLTTFLVASMLTPLLTWVACGQRLANLGAYYHWSWQIAAYYGAAMQAPPQYPLTDWVALGAIVFGLAATALFAWRERHFPARVAVYAMFAATLALTYRAGDTRAVDGGHTMLIWSICAWCAPLLAGMGYQAYSLRGARHAAMLFVLSILALALPRISLVYPGFTLHQLYGGRYTMTYVRHQFGELLHPDAAYRERVQQWAADRRKLALPEISRTVGDAPIDVMMDDQSALLANGMNYRPRPVFQSYSAYSSKLAQLNDSFFQSDRAPAWVMLNWRTASNNYPTSDDSRALIRLLQDYQPLLTEGDYILMRHHTQTHDVFGNGEPVSQIPIHFDSPTPIPAPPSGAWFAKLDVKLTIFGKLEALLFRAPRLAIEAHFQDGSHDRYFLVRDIARSGFMLSPAPASNTDYLDWLRGSNNRYVTSLQLVQATAFGHAAFRATGPLRLYPLHIPRRSVPQTLALYSNLLPGFDRMPTSIPASVRSYRVDGKPVLFLAAPASLIFSMPAGTYAVHATYGLMPNALTAPACLAAHADGIGFQIGIKGQPNDPATVAFLNPFGDPQHRYSADYSRMLTVGAGQMVKVSMTTGPAGSNGSCDWSWIRDLRFINAAAPASGASAAPVPH